MGNKLTTEHIDKIKLDLIAKLGPLLDEKHYDKIPTPEKTDWLANVKERGQTVDQYLNSKYIKPTDKRNVIYIVPLDIDYILLGKNDYENIRYYVEIFFQMKTILMDIISIDFLNIKKNIDDGIVQYSTNDIQNNLKKIIPKDAFCIIGFTSLDLYSNGLFSKSFVFGESTYYDRVGVFSIARFAPKFYEDNVFNNLSNVSKDQQKFIDILKKDVYKDTVFNRALKIVTHEILHMFSMDHCIFYNCLLCGCNGVHELDRWSFTLCCICIQKLYIANPFSVEERHNKLLQFYRDNNIESEVNKNIF